MASAAEDLRKRVKKDDRIAFRRQKTENIQTVGQEEADTKPAGLWYGCGTGWLEFASSEFESGLGKYVYKLDIDYSKVLRISEDGQLLKFTSEFKAPLRDYEKIFKGEGKRVSNIDWGKVASKYGGIEINPYIPGLRLDHRTSWYYGWDVASGCLWNQSALKKLELFAAYDEKKDEYLF